MLVYYVQTYDDMDEEWFTQYRGTSEKHAKYQLGRLQSILPRLKHRIIQIHE